MPTTEYLSAQYDPTSIVRIAEELKRQKATKFDLIYPANRLSVADLETIHLESSQLHRVGSKAFVDYAMAEAELDRGIAAKEYELGETKITQDDRTDVELSRTALTQIAGRLEPRVPVAFIDRMSNAQNGDLISQLVTDMLKRDERRFMLRCLDGKVRAVLSSKYKVLDNEDVFFAAVDEFGKANTEMWKARLWDDGFELFGVASHISGEVRLDRTFDPGDGWQSRWAGRDGDVQNAAVRISNSETGRGGLNVNSSIITKICANFCVWGQGISCYHSGSENEANEKGVVTSDRTRTARSELIWSRVRDAITTAFDPVAFQKQVDLMNSATQVEIPADRIEASVDNVVGEYKLSEDRKAAILKELLATGDRSQYGLTQAVTHAAHEVNDSNGSQASELEAIGNKVLSKDRKQFDKLLEIPVGVA